MNTPAPTASANARVIKRKLPIRPLFHQTDMMGVIHNAVYLLWFEEGRLQIMTEVLPIAEALDLGVGTPVIENHCAYLKSVRYGDPLVLITSHVIQPVYAGRLVFEHSLVHEKFKTEMARGYSSITLVTMRDGQLVKTWPADLWNRYQQLPG